MLELQPGLTESGRATNTMTVTTTQTLAACSAIGGRTLTNDWANDPTTCGSSDYVSPRGGPNLFTVKGVRGSVTGAATADGQECSPLVTATGGSVLPHAVHRHVGRRRCRRLGAAGVNGGTTSVEDLTIFDPLAAPATR